MIELVVFDMAGTTVYDGNAVAACFRAAFAAVDVHPDPQAVNDVMGFHKPEAIRKLLSAGGRIVKEADVERIHADFVERMMRYYATDPAVREIPGAAHVFAQLRKAGVKVALNTGFNRQVVDAILQRLGWTKAIDASMASDESPRGRPHPDMIHAFMARLGSADARRVAKVGDTPVDLQEGANAGCSIIVGVTTGSFARAELERHPHTHIVDSVTEVPALVLR